MTLDMVMCSASQCGGYAVKQQVIQSGGLFCSFLM